MIRMKGKGISTKMQFTFETQGSNTFLVYEIQTHEQLDSMTMGMVGNNRLDGVIPFNYTQMDSQRLLKYNVSSRVSLAQYFNGIVNKKRLIGVMESLAMAVLNAQDYMLEVDSFVWDKEYIFVDVSTAKAELICLPIVKETQEVVELETIFKSMFFGVQFDQTENCDYIAKLLGFFNANAHFSLQEFLKLLKELEGAEETKTPDQNAIATETQASPVQQGNSIGQVSPTPQASPAPQMSSAAMSAPAASQAAVPAQKKATKTPKAPKPPKAPKEKKGFSLFGKKEKKPAANVQTSLPGRSTGTVPGMSGAPASVGNFTPNQGQAVPTQSQQNAMSQGEKQGIGNAYVAPAYNTQQASFGGTVVLNASNNPGTVVLSAANNPQNMKPVPYLVRVSNGQRIPLNKAVVKIGSDASYADVVIADNKAISRSHADIRIKEEKVFLVDNNSTNHSYVGGRMINPNVEEGLVNGSTFRLANEEFELHMS